MTAQRSFEHFLAIDWSGAAGPRQKGIAMAFAHAGGGAPVLVDPGKGWSRLDVLGLLRDDLPANTLVGVDLGIGLPYADCGAFFPGWDGSPADAPALWELIDHMCMGDPDLSVSSFVADPAISRYFRRQPEGEGNQFRCDGAAHGRGRFRVTELVQEAQGCKPYSNFNLIGAAQVGKSSLTGMRVLSRLRGHLPVWPIDPIPDQGSLLVEIYTTIAARQGGRSASASKMRTWEDLDDALEAVGSARTHRSGDIDDHSSDALLASAWLRSVAHRPEYWRPAAMTPEIAGTEGWTFGAL